MEITTHKLFNGRLIIRRQVGSQYGKMVTITEVPLKNRLVVISHLSNYRTMLTFEDSKLSPETNDAIGQALTNIAQAKQQLGVSGTTQVGNKTIAWEASVIKQKLTKPRIFARAVVHYVFPALFAASAIASAVSGNPVNAIFSAILCVALLNTFRVGHDF